MFLQIPMVQICPKAGSHTGCHLYYGYEEDQEIELQEMPIVLAYNGIDHFTPTVLCIPNMMVGIDNLIELFNQCSQISTDLGCASKDKKVSDLFSKMKKEINAMSEKAVNIFEQVVQSDEEEEEEGEPSQKKMKLDTVTKKSKMTDCYCACGIEFGTPDLQLEHESQVHYDNQWFCSKGENCKKGNFKYGSSKALKRHFRTEHLGEKLHWCPMCNTGSNEKKTILSHMNTAHSAIKKFKCYKTEGCERVFPSSIHLKKHQKYCGEVKSHVCQYCQKKFMREENMLHHLKVIHTLEFKRICCNECGGKYQSKTSFENHLKWYCQKKQTKDQKAAEKRAKKVKNVQFEEKENEDDDDDGDDDEEDDDDEEEEEEGESQ